MAISFRLLSDVGDPPPKAWLVQGWFGARDVVMVRGKPKSGKSTLIAGLAAAVATGEPWLDRIAAGGAVLWIAAERSDDTLRNLRGVIDDGDAPIAITSGAVDLTNKDAATDLVAVCNQVTVQVGHPMALVVIDTLSRCIAGADENAAKEMSVVMANLNAIANETGATIVLLHHTNKGGTTRGSTAIDAAVDCVLEVSDEARGHSVEVVSMSAAPDGEKAWFTIQPARNGLKAVPITADRRQDNPRQLGPKAKKVWELICSLADDGSVARPDLLQAARRAKCVEGKDAHEALRKLLKAIEKAGLISIDEQAVFVTAECPTVPHRTAPPYRGERGVWGGQGLPHRDPTVTPPKPHRYPTDPTEGTPRFAPPNGHAIDGGVGGVDDAVEDAEPLVIN